MGSFSAIIGFLSSAIALLILLSGAAVGQAQTKSATTFNCVVTKAQLFDGTDGADWVGNKSLFLKIGQGVWAQWNVDHWEDHCEDRYFECSATPLYYSLVQVGSKGSIGTTGSFNRQTGDLEMDYSNGNFFYACTPSTDPAQNLPAARY